MLTLCVRWGVEAVQVLVSAAGGEGPGAQAQDQLRHACADRAARPQVLGLDIPLQSLILTITYPFMGWARLL